MFVNSSTLSSTIVDTNRLKVGRLEEEKKNERIKVGGEVFKGGSTSSLPTSLKLFLSGGTTESSAISFTALNRPEFRTLPVPVTPNVWSFSPRQDKKRREEDKKGGKDPSLV